MKKLALIAVPLALAFAATPALADKGRGHGGKHEWKEEGRHDNGRHLGWYKKAYKRGDRLVWVDVDRRYYVTDYRAYHLDAPPPGYRWVRPMDDRYLLVNVATGVIARALGY